jgi:uncharacterized membrane protein
MSASRVPVISGASRKRPRRLIRARRQLRAGLAQLLCGLAGLALGFALPQVPIGPTVDGANLTEPLFTLGLGVVGVVSIVFALLFGVVQWAATSFSPRLNLFREDPLVWRTFAFAVGVFVYSVTAGLVSASAGRTSVAVPITAVLAVLVAFGMIRALQTRAFLSLQLAHVLAALTSRGRAVLADVYPPRVTDTVGRRASPPAHRTVRRTVTWASSPGVVQQLELRDLINTAAHADAMVVFRVGVGDTVHEGAPLADLYGGDVPDQEIRSAVVRGTERSFDQDPMLALRLLADIGLRALSPAVSDPATAVDAIDAAEGVLRSLATRELDVADVADDAGHTRVRLLLPTWEDYLRIAVEDLLPAAAPFKMVLQRLRRLLAGLLDTPGTPQQTLLRLNSAVEDGLR